ncbi:Hypothetical predicted protein [Cloeon dipterum]|uniref:Uncharacterized protein n=1 Tax=Cloeon dipterum TaxID=197152 RepID=A0A8S1DDQ2_9INSE|nr:Hypothetical predicted protein [Cloeon dipterum]
MGARLYGPLPASALRVKSHFAGTRRNKSNTARSAILLFAPCCELPESSPQRDTCQWTEIAGVAGAEEAAAAAAEAAASSSSPQGLGIFLRRSLGFSDRPYRNGSVNRRVVRPALCRIRHPLEQAV